MRRSRAALSTLSFLRWVVVGVLAVCLTGAGCARWGFEPGPSDSDRADSGPPGSPAPPIGSDASTDSSMDASSASWDAGDSVRPVVDSGDASCGSGCCEAGACFDASADASWDTPVVATCSDGLLNQTETGIDCGGPCAACGNGDGCSVAGDCTSGVCTGSVCQAATCGDGTQNQGETAVDCGGPCGACGNGASCSVAGDCASGVCTGSVCQAATCGDGVQNQGETAVDCGGPCAPCACTYGTPVVLGNPNFSGNDVFSPTLTSNSLQIVVGVEVGSNPEFIALATRGDTSSEFGLAPRLPAPVDQAVEGSPHISPNGLSLYFYSTRSGGDRDLFRATRPSDSSNFDTVSQLTTLNSSAADHQPWVSANELEIYFVSDRGGNPDIYYASRASTVNAFSAPSAVAELNSTSSENGVALSADGLVALITSSRGGVGGQDIFRAARANTAEPFSTPVLVAGVNSTADDLNVALTPDGQFIYFSSNFNSSDYRIWRATRSCP